MTNCFTIFSAATGIFPYTAEEDITLVGFTSDANASAFTISKQPTLVAADIYNGGNGTVIRELIAASLTGSPNSWRPVTQLDYQLKKGESVYFSFDHACMVAVYYEPTQLS